MPECYRGRVAQVVQYLLVLYSFSHKGAPVSECANHNCRSPPFPLRNPHVDREHLTYSTSDTTGKVQRTILRRGQAHPTRGAFLMSRVPN